MTELPVMPFYVDDWLLDTRDLSPHAYMAYHRLLCELWRSRSDALPMDHRSLRNRAGIGPQKWPSVWAEIMHLFVVEEGQVRSQRGSKVKAAARAKYAARVSAGHRGAQAKWRKTKGPPDGKSNGKRNGKSNADGHGNHNQTGINTSAREARGLSEFEIKRIKAGAAPSPMPPASRILEAIQAGQITQEEADATMRGYF
jgi:uncharacterized protein YdaU (DUF1376 family)